MKKRTDKTKFDKLQNVINVLIVVTGLLGQFQTNAQERPPASSQKNTQPTAQHHYPKQQKQKEPYIEKVMRRQASTKRLIQSKDPYEEYLNRFEMYEGLRKNKHIAFWLARKKLFEDTMSIYRPFVERVNRKKRLDVCIPQFNIPLDEQIIPKTKECDELIKILTNQANYKNIQKAFYKFNVAYHKYSSDSFKQVLELSKFINTITDNSEDPKQTEPMLYRYVPVFLAMASTPPKTSASKEEGYLTTEEMQNVVMRACKFVSQDPQSDFVSNMPNKILTIFTRCSISGLEDANSADVIKEFSASKLTVAATCLKTLTAMQFLDAEIDLIRSYVEDERIIQSIQSPSNTPSKDPIQITPHKNGPVIEKEPRIK